MENKTYLIMMERNPDIPMKSIEMMYGLPANTLKNLQRDAIKKLKFSKDARKRDYNKIISQKAAERDKESRNIAKKTKPVKINLPASQKFNKS